MLYNILVYPFLLGYRSPQKRIFVFYFALLAGIFIFYFLFMYASSTTLEMYENKENNLAIFIWGITSYFFNLYSCICRWTAIGVSWTYNEIHQGYQHKNKKALHT
jgi:hypothetical protein